MDLKLSTQLREHAYRKAGGGPGEGPYDPETLQLELDAADMIDTLENSVYVLRLETAKLRHPSNWQGQR